MLEHKSWYASDVLSGSKRNGKWHHDLVSDEIASCIYVVESPCLKAGRAVGYSIR